MITAVTMSISSMRPMPRPAIQAKESCLVVATGVVEVVALGSAVGVVVVEGVEVTVDEELPMAVFIEATTYN